MLPKLWRSASQYGREYTRFSSNARLYLVSFFFSGLAFSSYILFFNFYLRSLHYDEAAIGLLNAVMSLGGILFAIPAGLLGDKIGRKRMMVIGTVVQLVGFIGFCLSESVLLLTLTLLVDSFGVTILWTMAAPFMADNSQPQDRTQLFSLQFAIGTFTHFIGSVGGGFLPRLYANWLGVPTDSTPALRATLLTAGFCILTSLIPLLMLKEEKRKKTQEQEISKDSAEAHSSKSKMKKRWLPRNPKLVLWLILPETLIGLGAGMTIPFLNLYINTKFGVDFEGLGLLFGFAELGTTLTIFIQPLLARRFGKVHSVVLFQGLSLPLVLLLGFAPYFWLVAIAMYVRGALMNAANPVYQVFIQEQVPDDERATTSAFLSVTDNVARGGGSAFSGFVRSSFGTLTGFNVLFGLMVALYASSIAAFYFRFRDYDRIEKEKLAKEAALPLIKPARSQQEVEEDRKLSQVS